MSKKFWMTGLVPATFTPMHEDGRLNPGAVAPMVERLLALRSDALFVCGTTGESSSLTTAERKSVLESFLEAAAGRVPVVAHVGHSALADCRELAVHAQAAGAAAFAATPPFYFRPGSVSGLVDCVAEIAAAAPQLPFYYYHIPHLTGVALSMTEFLHQAKERIGNLAGIKYTSPTLYEFQSCMAVGGGRFNMVFGVDEMYLAGLATGAAGAVGNTYNRAPALYRRIRENFEAARLAEARRLQLLSVRMVELVQKYRPLPALKAMMKFAGIDCGPTRLPLAAMRADEIEALRRGLDELGFIEWMS